MGLSPGCPGPAYTSLLPLCLISGPGSGPRDILPQADLRELPTQGHNDQDSRPPVPSRAGGDQDLAAPTVVSGAWGPQAHARPHQEPEDSSATALTTNRWPSNMLRTDVSFILAAESLITQPLLSQRACPQTRLRLLVRHGIECYLSMSGGVHGLLSL